MSDEGNVNFNNYGEILDFKDDSLTFKQITEDFEVCHRTLKENFRKKKIPHAFIFGQWRVKKDSFVKFINSENKKKLRRSNDSLQKQHG